MWPWTSPLPFLDFTLYIFQISQLNYFIPNDPPRSVIDASLLSVLLIVVSVQCSTNWCTRQSRMPQLLHRRAFKFWSTGTVLVSLKRPLKIYHKRRGLRQQKSILSQFWWLDNLKSQCWQGHILSEDLGQDHSSPHPSCAIAEILGVPCLVAETLQSLPLSSHSILPVSLSLFSLF